MPTESTFLLAGLFILLAAIGWALGRFGERDNFGEIKHPLNIDYLKGLNFLLNEQTDQALEHFLKMVRVDDKTIETHFALGSLFRRRGEIDRAIRIHQNIIARPDLAPDQKEQALFSLAKDYQNAGLLDRAENVYANLISGSRYQIESLQQLLRIYEHEKEWEKAIDSSQKLEKLNGKSIGLKISHYYCELAETAIKEKKFDEALSYVTTIKKYLPNTLRMKLVHAKIACEMNNLNQAIELYCSILEENTYLITEALPHLFNISSKAGLLKQLDSSIKGLCRQFDGIKVDIAYTAIVHNLDGVPIIDECVKEYMFSEPTLSQFIDLQSTNVLENGSQNEVIIKVRKGLYKLATSSPKYQCKECGFSSQHLLWHCPSCKNWETQRPFSNVHFDSLLQRSVVN